MPFPLHGENRDAHADNKERSTPPHPHPPRFRHYMYVHISRGLRGMDLREQKQGASSYTAWMCYVSHAATTEMTRIFLRKNKLPCMKEDELFFPLPIDELAFRVKP
jgi:hypothetical protein